VFVLSVCSVWMWNSKLCIVMRSDEADKSVPHVWSVLAVVQDYYCK